MIVGNRVHNSRADTNHRAVLRVVRLRAGAHGDGLRAFLVGSHFRGLRGALDRVAGLAQLIRDEADCQLLSRAHLARSGIDFGCRGKDGLLQAVVHNVLILDVQIAEDNKKEYSSSRNCQQPRAQQRHLPGMLAREPRKPDRQRHRRSFKCSF